jgi:DNA-binding NarL/FixJ family response regulator
LKHEQVFFITIDIIHDRILVYSVKRGGIVRVLIADDQADVLNALRVLLEQQEMHFVIDEAEDADGLFLKLEKTKPDLLLLDWELSNRDMADVIPRIRELAEDIRIIAMSVDPEAESQAKAAGVDAFVSKGDSSEPLLSAIYTIR